MISTVTTQAELDAALADPNVDTIELARDFTYRTVLHPFQRHGNRWMEIRPAPEEQAT